MGCICSKGAAPIIKKKRRGKQKEPKKSSSKRLIASSKKEDVVVEVDNGANDATTRLISTENAEKSTGSTPPSQEDGEKSSQVLEKPMETHMSRRDTVADGMAGGQPKISRVFSVQNGVDGAQIVAGWPPWLTAVAGEAIKGWVPRRADSFEKLDKVYDQLPLSFLNLKPFSYALESFLPYILLPFVCCKFHAFLQIVISCIHG